MTGDGSEMLANVLSHAQEVAYMVRATCRCIRDLYDHNLWRQLYQRRCGQRMTEGDPRELCNALIREDLINFLTRDEQERFKSRGFRELSFLKIPERKYKMTQLLDGVFLAAGQGCPLHVLSLSRFEELQSLPEGQSCMGHQSDRCLTL